MGTSKIYLCLDMGTGTRETLEMAFGRKELGNSGSVNVRSKIQFGQSWKFTLNIQVAIRSRSGIHETGGPEGMAGHDEPLSTFPVRHPLGLSFLRSPSRLC